MRCPRRATACSCRKPRNRCKSPRVPVRLPEGACLRVITSGPKPPCFSAVQSLAAKSRGSAFPESAECRRTACRHDVLEHRHPQMPVTEAFVTAHPAVQRALGVRFLARALRRLPHRPADRLQLQAPGVLPQLRHPPYGRGGSLAGRRGLSGAAGPAVGTEFPVSAALFVRRSPGGDGPGTGDRLPGYRHAFDQESRFHPHPCTHGCGHPDPTFQQCAESECPFPHNCVWTGCT